MNLEILYKGLILGFSVAVPVGPIGVLCINRTLNKSYMSGIVSGLGAASADLIYGLIAGLGLTIISNFLISQKLWIQGIGLIFLFYLGVKTLMKKEAKIEFNKNQYIGMLNDYFTTFVLTIANPVTILFFLAVFSGIGLPNPENEKFATIPLVLGVFIGSGIWWLFLSGLTHKLKKKISGKILKRIDLVSGLLIIAFGLFIVFDLIHN